MNKTKSKVLSLVLASAMIVSSFSSLNFASAATTRETGSLDTNEDTLYLVSRDTTAGAATDEALDALLGNVTVKTYDHESAGAPDFVSFTHASGDRLVKIDSDGNLSVKKSASGKEVITVTYEADYTRNDKDVVVRGSKDITVYADEENKQFVAKYTTDLTERPGDYSSAAVNQGDLLLGVYSASGTTGSVEATYAASPLTGLLGTADATTGNIAVDSNKLKLKSTNGKVFGNISILGVRTSGTSTTPATSDDTVSPAGTTLAAGMIAVQTTYTASPEKMAATGTDTLRIKLDTDTSYTDFKIAVEKKWKANAGAEVNKKSGTTYITKNSGSSVQSVSWDNWDSTEKAKTQAISGYAIDAAGILTVKGGTVGNISGTAADQITVEAGTVGDIKGNVVSVEGGSVGNIKVKDDTLAATIDVSDGKVKAIDEKTAVVTIDGGVISGNVVGASVDIDAADETIPTTINGDVTAKGFSSTVDPDIKVSSSSDAAVKVAGALKGNVTLADAPTIGTVNADYQYDISFEAFKGKVSAIKNADNNAITVDGDSAVTLSGKVTADSLTVDTDGKFSVGEGYFNSIDGEGTLAVPAGKLFVEDSMVDITLQLTSGLVTGATAFQAYSDSVSVDDFNALGYTLEQKVANSDVDKFVIKSVNFAGVQFDKTDLSIAKGQSSTLTVSAYPTGTALPAGASIQWNIDANDDYITMTTDGNVATIKVVDFNADYATDNKATVTATVVDADGNELVDYIAATADITATALPVSTVTLDTTKPVTVGTGAVYQYLAKSSTGAVMSAASSDTQIATVELFNAADPRGYKFQVKGVAEGTATITTTDANGATATLTVNVVKVNGTLKADTTTYTFAPGKVYDVKFSTTGTTAVPVVTVNGKVVSIAPRGNGVYRVTAQNAGTAYVVATVGNTHVSVKFVVAAGAASAGVTGNNVSILK